MSIKQSPRQKNVAARALSALKVSKPYRIDFKANDSIYLFDSYINEGEAQRIAPNSELMDKVREIEKARNVKIYAVTHDYLPLVGEMYSFLCISPYQEDWIYSFRLSSNKQLAIVYAYVYNVANPECIESGSVFLGIGNGKLVRVG
ncbi:MAG: hypothetical protein K2L54_02235 [Clostridiales bacterium]|nr:hypothetical protein [Clostridiales bacterium]